MDDKTKYWILECISTAPTVECLNGIISTLKWMYSFDKDVKSYTSLLERIENKKKLL